MRDEILVAVDHRPHVATASTLAQLAGPVPDRTFGSTEERH